jgi:peptidoglycan biosynthesis protein MviN/MurJ (putative lipid II flippase)
MAAGTLVSFSAQAVVMLYLLDRRVGGLGLRASAGTILKMVLATGAMTAACIAVQHLPAYPQGQSRLIWAAQLLLIMGVGATVYLGVCAALRVNVVATLLPKRGRKSNNPSIESM